MFSLFSFVFAFSQNSDTPYDTVAKVFYRIFPQLHPYRELIGQTFFKRRGEAKLLHVHAIKDAGKQKKVRRERERAKLASSKEGEIRLLLPTFLFMPPLPLVRINLATKCSLVG